MPEGDQTAFYPQNMNKCSIIQIKSPIPGGYQDFEGFCSQENIEGGYGW